MRVPFFVPQMQYLCGFYVFFRFIINTVCNGRMSKSIEKRRTFGNGTLHSDDDYCFWTDTYYATVQEMNDLYHEHGLDIVDHFAQDGISP